MPRKVIDQDFQDLKMPGNQYLRSQLHFNYKV